MLMMKLLACGALAAASLHAGKLVDVVLHAHAWPAPSTAAGAAEGPAETTRPTLVGELGVRAHNSYANFQGAPAASAAKFEANWQRSSASGGSGAACDLASCTCDGVDLSGLKGKVYQLPTDAEGYAVMMSMCSEIPTAQLPAGCIQYAEHPTVVKYMANNPHDCIQIGSVGPCSQGAWGMAGAKTATGVTVTYMYTYGCRNTFALSLTPGSDAAPGVVSSNECAYNAAWAVLKSQNASVEQKGCTSHGDCKCGAICVVPPSLPPPPSPPPPPGPRPPSSPPARPIGSCQLCAEAVSHLTVGGANHGEVQSTQGCPSIDGDCCSGAVLERCPIFSKVSSCPDSVNDCNPSAATDAGYAARFRISGGNRYAYLGGNGFLDGPTVEGYFVFDPAHNRSQLVVDGDRGHTIPGMVDWLGNFQSEGGTYSNTNLKLLVDGQFSKMFHFLVSIHSCGSGLQYCCPNA